MVQVRLTSLGLREQTVGVDILGAFAELEQLNASHTHGVARIESVTEPATVLVIGPDSMIIRLSEKTCLILTRGGEGSAHTFDVHLPARTESSVFLTFS